MGGKGPPVGPSPPDSDSGGGGDTGASDQGDGKIYVPLASLATPDEGEQMQTPQVGDSGSMQVDYMVQSIEGDQACIKPTAINGTPLPTADDTQQGPEDQTDTSDGTSPETAEMGQQLGQQAQAMGQR
jgi:hypothetical protein